MNTETKQPAAGEYWQWDRVAERVRIIANDDGDIVYRNRRQEIRTWLRECSDGFVDLFRHLPDCDSFDWKETVYPMYVIEGRCTKWANSSYIRIDSPNSATLFRTDGEQAVREWDCYDNSNVSTGIWKIVSREEAEARHERLHREWVISQLVVIDREKWPDHVPRAGIDWRRDYVDCTPPQPIKPVVLTEGLKSLPEIRYYNNSLHYCLPKDLPPEPAAAVAPANSYRLVDLHVFVAGLEFFVYRLPIYMAGDIKVEATLILEDHTKYPTISMNLTDVVEEAF